jgi:hypothetical protein
MDFHLQGSFPYRYSRWSVDNLRTLVRSFLSRIAFLSVCFVTGIMKSRLSLWEVRHSLDGVTCKQRAEPASVNHSFTFMIRLHIALSGNGKGVGDDYHSWYDHAYLNNNHIYRLLIRDDDFQGLRWRSCPSQWELGRR